MSKYSTPNVSKIIDKLKEYFNVKTDTDLAKSLGMSVSTVSNWRIRDSINYEIIFQNVKNVDYNWLLFDKEYENQEEFKHEKTENIKVSEEKVEYNTRASEPKKEYIKIPVYHGVGAGNPTEHYDLPKEFIRIDHIVNKNYVGVTVNTADYKDYGFEKGDVLLVDTMRAPKDENLVLIDIDNRYGLFVYLDKGKEIEIKNFNDGKISRFLENMTVVGVVVTKMKHLI